MSVACHTAGGERAQLPLLLEEPGGLRLGGWWVRMREREDGAARPEADHSGVFGEQDENRVGQAAGWAASVDSPTDSHGGTPQVAQGGGSWHGGPQLSAGSLLVGLSESPKTDVPLRVNFLFW